MMPKVIEPEDEAGQGRRPDPPVVRDGASIRDELLRRLAHVLLDQYGADVTRHVEERERACALRGDRAGVTEWHDVARMVGELERTRGSLHDDLGFRPAGDYPVRADMRPVSREWAFWAILCVLAGAILILALIARHIW